MQFTQINRTDADKVWVVGKNVSGATISAHSPVNWDQQTVSDGHAFSAVSAPHPGLFAGITDRQSDPNEDGVLIQVFGYRTSAYVSQVSAAITAPTFLQPVSGTLRSQTSAADTAGMRFVTLMRSTSAKSAGTIDVFPVFIRAM